MKNRPVTHMCTLDDGDSGSSVHLLVTQAGETATVTCDKLRFSNGYLCYVSGERDITLPNGDILRVSMELIPVNS